VADEETEHHEQRGGRDEAHDEPHDEPGFHARDASCEAGLRLV
jgi:hypothetical protein